MSNCLNRVMLMGNIGANPELAFGDTDNPCLKLSLATTDTWRDKNQERHERTEWHNVEMWGPRAKSLSSFLTKGTRVWVDGSIRSRTVEGQGGSKRRYTDIRARDLIVVESRRAREERDLRRTDLSVMGAGSPASPMDVALAS
jgi:single-strand DNA-binding protein